MEEILKAFGVDWRLIVIQVFNFALLAALLWYFLYTPVLKILNERQEKIKKGVEDAESAENALPEVEGKRQTIISDANKQADEINMRAKAQADERKSELLKDAEARAESIVHDAEGRSKALEEGAVRKSEAEIAKLAVLAAEKILRE